MQASVLYGIQFALDGGDTHVNLDPIQGRMTASDLRIRMEIGSSAAPPSWTRVGEGAFQTIVGKTNISVRSLYGAMDGFGPFRWETAVDGTTVRLDYVLYQGEPAEIDFHAMEEALFLFGLSLSEHDGTQPEALVSPREHVVHASLATEAADRPITLTLARKPAIRTNLFHD